MQHSADPAVRSVGQAEQLDDFCDLLERPRDSCQLRGEEQVLEAGEVCGQGRRLAEVRDPVSDGGEVLHGVAVHEEAPVALGLGVVQLRDQALQERRLARPGGPDDRRGGPRPESPARVQDQILQRQNRLLERPSTVWRLDVDGYILEDQLNGVVGARVCLFF